MRQAGHWLIQTPSESVHQPLAPPLQQNRLTVQDPLLIMMWVPFLVIFVVFYLLNINCSAALGCTRRCFVCLIMCYENWPWQVERVVAIFRPVWRSYSSQKVTSTASSDNLRRFGSIGASSVKAFTITRKYKKMQIFLKLPRQTSSANFHMSSINLDEKLRWHTSSFTGHSSSTIANRKSRFKRQASSVNFRRIVNVVLQFFESTLYVHSLDPVCSIMRFKIF